MPSEIFYAIQGNDRVIRLRIVTGQNPVHQPCILLDMITYEFGGKHTGKASVVHPFNKTNQRDILPRFFHQRFAAIQLPAVLQIIQSKQYGSFLMKPEGQDTIALIHTTYAMRIIRAQQFYYVYFAFNRLLRQWVRKVEPVTGGTSPSRNPYITWSKSLQ